ncbi:MAG: 3-deoxy-D-manno-octulosonic acid transferase [Bacteroidetes bacterium]|nr:3-deoxy-D-manno-octulosonic acid transferase [Bacteroidota bacterium]
MIAKMLYNFAIHLYGLAIRIAAGFDLKAKLWVNGRRDWQGQLKQKAAAVNGKRIIWLHCASLGEFEQGRPLIEVIKQRHPEYAILLSFFSPSGYEVRKDYEAADIVSYLPLDTAANAHRFIDIIQPAMAIFVKYEFWLNYLDVLKEKNIDTYIVSAIFRPQQVFFKWYGGIFRKALRSFKTIFVQDAASEKLLESIGISRTLVCGDTRFDRVMEIRDRFKPIPEIEQFKGDSRLIVAGSTWPKDEDLLLEAFDKFRSENVKMILVPHDIKDDLLNVTADKLRKYRLDYCLYTEGIKAGAQVLVLNTIGLLSRLYYYADVSYIGGGFDGGLHNCLEAAVYGKPITFADPKYAKYNEAVALLHIGAAVNVSNAHELQKVWKTFLADEVMRKAIAVKTGQYFMQNARATDKILAELSL